MSLLTVLHVKNIHIMAGIYLILLKKCPRSNLRDFQYQILGLSEKIGKLIIKKDKF